MLMLMENIAGLATIEYSAQKSSELGMQGLVFFACLSGVITIADEKTSVFFDKPFQKKLND